MGGIPERRPGEGGSFPDPPVSTYPSEEALAQLHPLRRLHVEHLPLLGLGSAFPPLQKALPLGLGPRRRVWETDLASCPPYPPAQAADSGPALAAAPAQSPRVPLLSFHSGRASAARAPSHARSPASPPLALARAAADGPLRAVALRPARLPAAAARPHGGSCVSRCARARPHGSVAMRVRMSRHSKVERRQLVVAQEGRRGHPRK